MYIDCTYYVFFLKDAECCKFLDIFPGHQITVCNIMPSLHAAQSAYASTQMQGQYAMALFRHTAL